MAMRIPKFVAVGMAITVAVAVATVINLSGNQMANGTGDFRNVTTAEVRDAGGKILLRGTFAADNSGGNDVERGARLAPTPDGGQAAGEAEIEYSKDKPSVQEIEFEVTGVPARAIVTLVLDGKDVISATADDNGRPKRSSTCRSRRNNSVILLVERHAPEVWSLGREIARLRRNLDVERAGCLHAISDPDGTPARCGPLNPRDRSTPREDCRSHNARPDR